MRREHGATGDARRRKAAWNLLTSRKSTNSGAIHSLPLAETTWLRRQSECSQKLSRCEVECLVAALRQSALPYGQGRHSWCEETPPVGVALLQSIQRHSPSHRHSQSLNDFRHLGAQRISLATDGMAIQFRGSVSGGDRKGSWIWHWRFRYASVAHPRHSREPRPSHLPVISALQYVVIT